MTFQQRCQSVGLYEDSLFAWLDRVEQLTAERDHLSSLVDKWNMECDEMREDNKRLDSENAKLKSVLEKVTEFVDLHSEPWYTRGQLLLAKCHEALKDLK